MSALIPRRAKRPGGAWPDGRHLHPGKRARVLPAGIEGVEQKVCSVGARDHHKRVPGDPLDGLGKLAFHRPRLDPDGRGLDHLGAELAQPPRQPAGLGAGPGDHDRGAVQRAPFDPRQVLGKRRDRPDDGDGGRRARPQLRSARRCPRECRSQCAGRAAWPARPPRPAPTAGAPRRSAGRSRRAGASRPCRRRAFRGSGPARSSPPRSRASVGSSCAVISATAEDSSRCVAGMPA